MPIRLQYLGVAALTVIFGACSKAPADLTTNPTDDIAPLIAGTPPTSATPDAAYSFMPTASDQDGDAILFGIDAKPSWASFDTATGQLIGTPTAADVGIYRGIVIWVTDGKAATALPAFDLTVQSQGQAPGQNQPAPANRAPTIGGDPALTVVVGSVYKFTPTASDPDNDSLSFTIQNRPAWMGFDPTTGSLEGSPQAANVGTYADIVISVTDGDAVVSLPPFTLEVSVAAINSPPTISGTPMTSVEAGNPYSFVPTAADPDDNSLTFSIAGKPSWATFDMQTGALTGTPPTGTTCHILRHRHRCQRRQRERGFAGVRDQRHRSDGQSAADDQRHTGHHRNPELGLHIPANGRGRRRRFADLRDRESPGLGYVRSEHGPFVRARRARPTSAPTATS